MSVRAPEDVPADLTPARIAARLETRWLGHGEDRLVVLGSCGSTNDVAATFSRQGRAEGLVVATDQQSGGRGRLGRPWHSPPGLNLYMSVLLRPAGAPWTLPPLTLFAGVVVARALAAVGPSLAPRLKWPNDVLLEGPAGRLKICGILTEMASESSRVRHVVIGIGVNVNQEEFPPELAARATSMRIALGHTIDRAEFLARLLTIFEAEYDALVARGDAASIVDGWRRYGLLGERCCVDRDGERLVGIAEAIDRDGALKLRAEDGRLHRVVSGEIVDGGSP